MKADKLDRTQPFGTIGGDTEGRVYEQNHKFYGADEHVIGSSEPAEADDVTKPASKKAAKSVKKAKTAEDAQLDAQLGAAE